MTLLFISDLHLDPERPDSNLLFDRFLAGPARACQALYILGDFLEYWLGDDDEAGALEPLLLALRDLAQAGCPVHLMHGNRDFLIGTEFARRFGLQLLTDPTRIEIHGTPVLLMHGDTLCTDDAPYQAFRRMVRSAAWQQDFLAKPLQERRDMVRQLRETSRRETSQKAASIMDVNTTTVRETMQEAGVRNLIHGHTHRPGIHDERLGATPVRRMVLGDWYHRGSYLEVQDRHCRLLQFDADGRTRVTDERSLLR